MHWVPRSAELTTRDRSGVSIICPNWSTPLPQFSRSFEACALDSQTAGNQMGRSYKIILTIFLFGQNCVNSQERAAIWQPSPGYVQVPIWPGAVPDAMPNPKPESVGP